MKSPQYLVLEVAGASTVPFFQRVGYDVIVPWYRDETAWAACQAYPDLIETLFALSDDPTHLTVDSIHVTPP